MLLHKFCFVFTITEKTGKVHPSRPTLHQTRTKSKLAFLLTCVNEKGTKSSVARKEGNVCKGNLSRVNTVAALLVVVFRKPQPAPLPRNRLASSATGGASPVSPCFSIPPQDKFAQQTCTKKEHHPDRWCSFLVDLGGPNKNLGCFAGGFFTTLLL